jgi:hypothetical protein
VLLIVEAAVGLIVRAPAGDIATVPVPVGDNVTVWLDVVTDMLPNIDVEAPAVPSVRVPAGEIVTVLVPVGDMAVFKFEPLTVNCVNVADDAVVPPIAPGDPKVAPFKDEAFKFVTLVVDATTKGAVPVVAVLVIVVNLPVDAVVPPIAGGLDKSNVPPNVNEPELVTVPVNVIPLTVPVPETEVTVPVVKFCQLNVPEPLLTNACVPVLSVEGRVHITFDVGEPALKAV